MLQQLKLRRLQKVPSLYDNVFKITIQMIREIIKRILLYTYTNSEKNPVKNSCWEC